MYTPYMSRVFSLKPVIVKLSTFNINKYTSESSNSKYALDQKNMFTDQCGV